MTAVEMLRKLAAKALSEAARFQDSREQAMNEAERYKESYRLAMNEADAFLSAAKKLEAE